MSLEVHVPLSTSSNAEVVEVGREERALPTSSTVGRVGSSDSSGRTVEVGRGVCTRSLLWNRLEEPNLNTP